MLDLDNISQLFSMTQGCVMSLTQGHTSKVKVTHTQILYPGHNSSLPCWIWIIFHTIVVHDQRKCHDLDPRSHIQGQGQIAHITKYVCPGDNSSLPCWIWIIFHTIVVHDPRVCHDLEIFHTIVVLNTRVFHDLDPRSYLQGQGHSALIHKINVRAITLHCHVGSR